MRLFILPLLSASATFAQIERRSGFDIFSSEPALPNPVVVSSAPGAEFSSSAYYSSSFYYSSSSFYPSSSAYLSASSVSAGRHPLNSPSRSGFGPLQTADANAGSVNRVNAGIAVLGIGGALFL